MPALIPECIKRVEDDGERVTLLNPSGGPEVNMNAWEARLLPFLDSGPDARAVGLAAQVAGVKMPIDHIQALLDRLRAAGLLVPVPVPAVVPPPPEPPEPPEPPAAPSPPSATSLIGAFQDEDTQGNLVSEPLPPSQAPTNQGAQLGASAPPPPTVNHRKPIAAQPLPPAEPPPPLEHSTRTVPHAPAAPPAVPPAAPTLLERAYVPPIRRARQPPAPALPSMPAGPSRGRAVAIAGLGLAALVLTAAFVPSPYGVVAPCLLQPVVRQQVRLPVGATIQSIPVEEGQAVKAGDVLAVVDADKLKSDQARTLEAIAILDAELKRSSAGGRPDVARMRQLVDERTAQMRVAYLEFRRFEALGNIGQATRAETRKATDAITVAKGALIEAQSELADALASTPEHIHLKEAELERLRTTSARQAELAAAPQVRSAIDGTIATPRVRGRAGLTLEAGTELMEIVQLEHLRAEGRLPQKHLGSVQVGAPVQIEVTGVAEKFPSRLQLVGSGIEDEDGRRFVRLVAQLDNPKLVLRQNAQCLLEVETERESVLRALLRRAGR